MGCPAGAVAGAAFCCDPPWEPSGLLSPPKGGSGARASAAEDLLGPGATHLSTWSNCSNGAPLPAVQSCDRLASCPCCASRYVCPLTAIVRAPSLLRPRVLLALLLILSAFFRRSGSISRCSSCEEPERTRGAHRLLRACRYQDPACTHDCDRSPPLLTCSDLSCLLRPHRICLIWCPHASFGCCASSDRRSLRRWQASARSASPTRNSQHACSWPTRVLSCYIMVSWRVRRQNSRQSYSESTCRVVA